MFHLVMGVFTAQTIQAAKAVENRGALRLTVITVDSQLDMP